MLTDLEVREAFHCTLLRRLVAKVPEGLRLKGGVSLRLFFGSERYSEDMDFDADQRLNAKMRRVLDAVVNEAAFRRELLNLGIDDVSAPDQAAKHTDTTLRYKLQVVKGGVPLPTKVEMSFRSKTPAGWAVKKAPDAAVIAPYFPTHSTSFEVVSYPHRVAIWQKINALATRTAVQARDIFDLDMLLNERHGPINDELWQFIRDHHSNALLAEATTRSLEIGEHEFASQVVTYLPPQVRTRHESRWEEMRLRVHGMLTRVQEAKKTKRSQ